MTQAQEEELKQVHLNLPNMNGRGVRFRIIPSDAHGKAEAAGAALAGASAGPYQLRMAQVQECLYVMVRAITEPGVKDLHEAGVKWTDVDGAVLMTNWDKLFGPRETEVLKALYSRFHEVTRDEVDAILGKALPVSSGG